MIDALLTFTDYVAYSIITTWGDPPVASYVTEVSSLFAQPPVSVASYTSDIWQYTCVCMCA